jgi:hypothetical protein
VAYSTRTFSAARTLGPVMRRITALCSELQWKASGSRAPEQAWRRGAVLQPTKRGRQLAQSTRLDDPRKVSPRGAEREECAHQQVDGDSRIPRLHPGNSRLAGLNSCSQIMQRPALAPGLETVRKTRMQLDQRSILRRESQELLDGPGFPAATRTLPPCTHCLASRDASFHFATTS